MPVPITVLETIGTFSGWGSFKALCNAGEGGQEINIARQRLRELGKTVPRGPIPLGTLLHISSYANEAATASLVQAAKGSSEIKMLRIHLIASSNARQEFEEYYIDLADAESNLDATFAVLQHERHRYPGLYWGTTLEDDIDRLCSRADSLRRSKLRAAYTRPTSSVGWASSSSSSA